MRISFIFALFAFLAISSVAFAEDETTTANPVVVETTTAPPSGEETTLAPSESTTAAPSGEETTVAPSGEETTTAAPSSETTAAPSGEETTTAAPSESTTAAPSGEETTLAPSESTTAAPSGEETTTAAPSETTTAAPSSETTAAPSGEETTLAPSESTTAAPSGEETTAAPSGEETTAAPSGEETTVAPSGEETAAPTTVAPTTVAPTTNAPTTDAPTTQAPFQSFGPNGQETKGSFQVSSDSEVTKESVGEAIADTLKINETRVRVDSVTASRKRATSYQIDFAILEDASSGVSSVVLLKELQTTLSDGTALGSVGTVSGFKVVSVNYAAEYSTFGQTTATRANIQSGSVAMTFAVATSVALFALAL